MSRSSFRAWVVLFSLIHAIADWPPAAQAQQGDQNGGTITLKSSGDPPQVSLTTSDGRRRSYFVELGKTFFSEGRFVPTKFEKKEALNADGSNKDVTELTLRDLLRNQEMVLVMNVPQQFPSASEAMLQGQRNKTETTKVARAAQGELADFLFFLERLPPSTECTIALKSSGDPPLVTIATPDGHKRAFFVDVGKPFFSGGRFTPIKFEKKIVTAADGTEKDVSQLTVLDNVRKNQLVLFMNVAQHLPGAPEAILEWRHNKVEAVTAEEGKVFPMPGGSEAPYRLIKVEENSVTIAPVLPDGSLGKEVVIQKK